jgi:hypothetical protein
MGTPKKVDVNGTPVFICCEGCRGSLLAEPDKYLAKLAAGDVPAPSAAGGPMDLPPIGRPRMLDAQSGLPPIGTPQLMVEDDAEGKDVPPMAELPKEAIR